MRLALIVLSLLAFALPASARMNTFTWVPVITAAAYADGDQIGVLQKLTDILPTSSGVIDLRTLTVVDAEKVKHDFHIMLFNREVTVASSDNAAVDVADAQMVAGYLGTIGFVEADYLTLVSGSAAATKSPNLLLKGYQTRNLWYLLVCKDSGGCDYGAVTDLTFRAAFVEE